MAKTATRAAGNDPGYSEIDLAGEFTLTSPARRQRNRISLPGDVHTALIGGYSHFFAGRFPEQAGTGRDIDFGYLIFQYTL